MKKTLKTEDILNTYELLKNVDYQKLEDSDKVKVWKAVRQLKPVADQYEDAQQDAVKNLVPEDFTDNLRKAQAYEQQKAAGAKELPMTEKDYKAFIVEFQKYNKLLTDALQEQKDKEHEIEYEPLTEDALGLLVVSNNWSLPKSSVLDWLVE